MPTAIEEGESPAIRVFRRIWNDGHSGTMFSGFMVDASNIMKFEGAENLDSSAKYSVEWWIFKPSMDNKQVQILLYAALSKYHHVYNNVKL